MPRRGARRKKARTHVDEEKSAAAASKVPTSMILRQGRVAPSLSIAVEDLRKLMMPNTAVKLKERRNWALKEILKAAVPFKVTHLMLFTQTNTAVNMRLACLPRGPTLSFKVGSYVLSSDVARAQRRAFDVSAAFRSAPLAVLNNFDETKPHLKLASLTLQHMFPKINVNTVKVADCKRVVLFDYDAERDVVEMRHFAIRAVPAGVTRTVKKLAGSKLPNLSHVEDISEYVLEGAGLGGSTSDSEFEDEDATVAMPVTSRKAPRAQQNAVRLHELGPRLTMTLVKVQRGVCDGEILYHKHVSKSKEESVADLQRVRERERVRAERRAEQEANVARKQAEKDAKLRVKQERREAVAKERHEQALAAAAAQAEDEAATSDEERAVAPVGSVEGADEPSGEVPWSDDEEGAGTAEGGDQEAGSEDGEGAEERALAPKAPARRDRGRTPPKKRKLAGSVEKRKKRRM